jgi:membrane-associated phospholipid phosphatase
MKKKALCGVLLLCLVVPCFAQRFNNVDFSGRGIVPPYVVFNDVGWNFLYGFAHNFGVNFALAGLSTYALIESGADWAVRQWAFNHPDVANGFMFIDYLGYFPQIYATAGYIIGAICQDKKAQVTSLAVLQATLLMSAIQGGIKLVTGRPGPGILDTWDTIRNPSQQDFSHQFNWVGGGYLDGWPSGHTASAFALAAVVQQMYPNKIWLNVLCYSYACLIGAGASLNIHWLSDCIAGALMGLAIGHTVGKDFADLYNGRPRRDRRVFFYAYTGGIGAIFRL